MEIFPPYHNKMYEKKCFLSVQAYLLDLMFYSTENEHRIYFHFHLHIIFFSRDNNQDSLSKLYSRIYFIASLTKLTEHLQ